MKYIETLSEGEKVGNIYLCKHKQSAVTKNGKPYDNVILQDKTGVLDGKVWDPGSSGIEDFEALDYIEVYGDVLSYQGALQLNIKRLRKASPGEYDPKDYLPVSSFGIEEMYQELLGFIRSVKNKYLRALLEKFFLEDQEFARSFQNHSAAKMVHHGFVGGLLEHTLAVTKLCDYYTTLYPILNRDLLLTAAMLHDLGKTKELSEFPRNDYTDEGQLLGHIVMGVIEIGNKAAQIVGFPEKLERELKHCILAHHGEYEYGSPKKPALIEALALNFADNTDAKMETMREALRAGQNGKTEWLGYNRILETNIRPTSGTKE